MPPGRLEAIEVVVSVTKGEIRSWAVHAEACARRCSSASRCTAIVDGAGAPRLAGRDAPARHRRLRPGADRPVAGGQLRRRARGRPAHQPLHLVPPRADRPTTGTPDRSRASSRSSTRARARCSRSSTTASCRCRPTGARYLPDDVGPLRDRPPAARDRAARRPELHGRRQPRALAAVVVPRRLRPATRASCCTPSATTTATGSGRSCTARRSARWSCPTATPAPMHGWKNAFDAGEWGLGRMANSLAARLRLPRRDPLLRRGARRRAGRAVHGHERDLPARGGLRDPLEAPRPARRHRRGAPLAAPRRQLHRHRRQLRVRLLLVLLPRRHHPARGEAHRASCRPMAVAPGDAARRSPT